MFPPLTEEQIRLILAGAGIKDIGEIVKIPVGFSHDVYAVSGKYIVKFNNAERNELSLRKEVYFVNLFGKKIPTARIVSSDFTRKSVMRSFIVYEKVARKTLYSIWHRLTPEQRKRSILTICQYLRIINETKYTEYTELFNVDTKRSWSDVMVARIQKNIRVVKGKKLFTVSEIELIDRYVYMHQDALLEEKMALTYFDPHFDNFLADGEGRIHAMLDFERTDYLSIDVVLDLIKRMIEFPKKYASEKTESLVKKEDYQDIWGWFQEGYPELFAFSKLEERLSLYGLNYDLEMLLKYPESEEIKKEILGKVF